MESSPTANVLLDDAPRRERAKRRLYVMCQMGGWLFFLMLQLVFTQVFKSSEPQEHEPNYWNIVMIIAVGLLLTHFTRRYLTRWGWKDLGWRPLLPRILALSAVIAFVWCVIGYGWQFGVMGEEWPKKYHPLTLFFVSWINAAIMMVGWLCLYFFYHLFDRYNRLEIERLRLGTSVKEAELRALKAQVNPHFIFNSLNSVRALIDEDPARARQSVTRLANLLRYSLQSGQLETVPFEDELRVVNDYLALEQVRHEERLRVRLDIAPETLTLPVPPMLLQTLVENAVKYGISARPEGGEIAIVARRESDSLRLQVTNPGELATAAARVRTSSTGVGLRNAAERLRLLFGESATLRLRADTPELVVAEAIVPLAAARA
ncbi:MAG: sensor histidine kinase [Verrucomicrobia bacterium]|nr:sensor histidine kinase [Verrucomicrobiota bacterium]